MFPILTFFGFEFYQVLPLVEESGAGAHEGEEELFTMDEIKLEVMRSRGAGGQVRFLFLHFLPLSLFVGRSLMDPFTPLLNLYSTSTKRNQPSG